ncbi:hypothetical protein Tco_0905051 [Tanacetum coccineum]
MAPRAVLMKTGLKSFNTARPVNTVRSVNTGRPFSTARSFNTVRPVFKRPFYKRTALTKMSVLIKGLILVGHLDQPLILSGQGDLMLYKALIMWVRRPFKPNVASMISKTLIEVMLLLVEEPMEDEFTGKGTNKNCNLDFDVDDFVKELKSTSVSVSQRL